MSGLGKAGLLLRIIVNLVRRSLPIDVSKRVDPQGKRRRADTPSLSLVESGSLLRHGPWRDRKS
jgi:hypothetical protein